MRFFQFLLSLFILIGCTNIKAFKPVSQYPPDPWVKGYANPIDCIGGENLAVSKFVLPVYPRRAFKSGRQGWVLVKLDVNMYGETKNVVIERSLPDGLFEASTNKAIKQWIFDPPPSGEMKNCRILIKFRAGEVSLGG